MGRVLSELVNLFGELRKKMIANGLERPAHSGELAGIYRARDEWIAAGIGAAGRTSSVAHRRLIQLRRSDRL